MSKGTHRDASQDASPIQREIRQNKPFRSKGQEAIVALLRTSDVVRRQLARVVEPHEITLQQYNVLRILRGAGPEGIPTLSISERMIEETPGITRLLDRLEAKGLARRQRCPEDRRQVLCWLTPAGQSLLERLDEVVDQADEAVLGGLSAEENTELLRLLDAIRAGIRVDKS